MIGKKKTTTLADGPAEGTVVGIDQSVIKSSTVHLSDGTVLTLTPIIKEVLRVDGKFDNDGNTIYVVASGTIIGISHIRQELVKGNESHGQ